MELLAPAGSYQALCAAVQSGADAVYIGGTKFSARRSAENFTSEQMKEWIQYCHLYGVAVHVAANTLIKEKEAAAFLDYIAELYEMGTDAVIIQDIGMAEQVRQRFPELPLHASTQMTVASLEGVRYLEKMGFSRVVLSRELSREDVRKISENTDLELEVFGHGALCMCYSGQCLMSSLIGGRSGNRGLCAQPCRLPYTLTDGETEKRRGYLLSPKDLCLADELNDLKNLGITSLKIEGRLKRPEYVATVVGIYRRCIDEQRSTSNREKQQLAEAFSRSGFTDGYWKNRISGEMMSYQTPGNTAQNTYPEDAVNRCKDAVRKISVDISAAFKKDQPFSLTLRDPNGHIGFACSTEPPQKAEHRALDAERLTEQLKKMGNTAYQVRKLDIEVDPELTLPIRVINEVRREAVAELNRARMSFHRSIPKMTEYHKPSAKQTAAPRLTVWARTAEQAKAALSYPIARLYAPSEVLNSLKQPNQVEFVTVLPAIDRDEQTTIVPADGVLISHFAQLAHYPGVKHYGDFRLNLYNSASIAHFSGFDGVMPSPELNLHELRSLSNVVPLELFVYGRLPLMVMENCPSKAAAGICKPQGAFLEDRRKEHFPLICDIGCRRILLNAKPLDMADKMTELRKIPASFYRLQFTVETAEECRQILKRYTAALSGETVLPLEENTFTRGHYFRGVE